MRTNAILFDLDDTLIDTKARHFNIVSDFLRAHDKVIDFVNYLEMRKANKMSNKQIIQQYHSLDEHEFATFWNLNIENPDYFNYDKELVNFDLLEKLKKSNTYDFILLSLRSNASAAIQQSVNFSFFSLIDEYQFLKHADINPKIEKMIFFKSQYDHIIFVSDSQEDCNAAAIAGVEFAGVESGMYPLACQTKFKDINSFLLKYTYD
ncbi:hypothetical protein BH11BAC3_BH11BAC3_01140 [soil metagenome]